MNIVVTCHPTQGGSGVVATEIAEALSRRGHTVHLAAYSRPFRLAENTAVRFHPVSVLNYPLFQHPPSDLSFANRLAGIIKEHNIDLVPAPSAVPHSIPGRLARDIVQPHRVKIVTTLHGTDITLVGSHEDFYDLTRYSMIRADALTTVSTWLLRETQGRFNLPRAPECIPNFVDTERFNNAGRAAYPEKGGEFQLLHASNMRPVKRLTDVIRVFHLISRQVPAHLTILGDGPDRGMAEELAGELGVCKRITFGGIRADVVPILRRSHLFLLLSDYESFGLSALEAMACGTPVIASAAGGLPEVVAEGESGFLCPVGEVQCIARKAVKLLQDQGRWERMSRLAAKVARERYNLENSISQYEALYRRVLRKRS